MAGPDYSNAGPNRDAKLRALRLSKQPVARALLADAATTADEASVAFAVSKDSPRSVLDDAALMAFLTDEDRVQPVTVADFLAFLESRYVLTPIP